MNRLELEQHKQFQFLLVMSVAKPLIERRRLLFWRRFIREGLFALAAGVLYERGAVLSCAMGWYLKDIASLCAQPGNEALFLGYADTQVRKRLKRYGELFDSEAPNNFAELTVGLELKESAPLNPLLGKSGANVPLSYSLDELLTYLVEGLAFGAVYPEMTHRILGHEYEEPESPDFQESLADAQAHGLEVTERPVGLTAGAVEAMTLEAAAAIAALVSPEFASPFEQRLKDMRKAEALGTA